MVAPVDPFTQSLGALAAFRGVKAEQARRLLRDAFDQHWHRELFDPERFNEALDELNLATLSPVYDRTGCCMFVGSQRVWPEEDPHRLDRVEPLSEEVAHGQHGHRRPH